MRYDFADCGKLRVAPSAGFDTTAEDGFAVGVEKEGDQVEQKTDDEGCSQRSDRAMARYLFEQNDNYCRRHYSRGDAEDAEDLCRIE